MASITKEDALKIAREECERHNWPWNKCSKVKWGFFSYTVWGGGRKGGNLFIKIRKRDGVIIQSSMTPR
jgi:hypothetical protein